MPPVDGNIALGIQAVGVSNFTLSTNPTATSLLTDAINSTAGFQNVTSSFETVPDIHQAQPPPATSSGLRFSATHPLTQNGDFLDEETPSHFNSLVRRMVFGALSFASELENLVLFLIDRSPLTAIGFFGPRSERGIPCSRRGVFSYLAQLNLSKYDFSGKMVLDVGSGRSRFAQIIDVTYRDSGTRAIPVDLLVQPKSAIGMKADAVSLPFGRGMFGLVTNNWVLQHFLFTATGDSMLEEMLRVCKSGGEIRVSFQRDEPLDKLIAYLESHPAVERVVQHSRGMLTKSIEIHLRKEPPSKERLAAFYEDLERNGMIYVPWRLDVLAHRSSRARVIELRRGGLSDRLDYIADVRRFLNHDPSDPFVIDPEYPTVLASWFADSRDHFELRKSIVSLFMEWAALYPHFQEAWDLLSDLEKNSLMEYWLLTPVYRELLRRSPENYFEISGVYSPTVTALRDKLSQEIKTAAAIREIELEAKERFADPMFIR